jgi:UDP-N-acetylmuramyl pentapeptide synthase
MRWQVEHHGGITIINDAYNANPVSMKAAIAAFVEPSLSAGRRWLLLAGMHELGHLAESAHRDVGRYAGQQPVAGIITCGRYGRWLAEGARDAGHATVLEAVNHRDAAETLARHLVTGDELLVKGSRGEALETVLTHWKTSVQEEAAS